MLQSVYQLDSESSLDHKGKGAIFLKNDKLYNNV